jgi:hypothetical protein
MRALLERGLRPAISDPVSREPPPRSLRRDPLHPYHPVGPRCTHRDTSHTLKGPRSTRRDPSMPRQDLAPEYVTRASSRDTRHPTAHSEVPDRPREPYRRLLDQQEDVENLPRLEAEDEDRQLALLLGFMPS